MAHHPLDPGIFVVCNQLIPQGPAQGFGQGLHLKMQLIGESAVRTCEVMGKVALREFRQGKYR